MKRYPGKFEGCADQRLGMILHNILGDGGARETWAPPNDGYGTWYGLIYGRKTAYIIHEDTRGFFDYNTYPTHVLADRVWAALVADLDTEYTEEEQETHETYEQIW